MANASNLSALLGTYLSPSERADFAKLGEYEWFRHENKVAFYRALEPLAYATKLGLKHQVKNYFSCVMATYRVDLCNKMSHLVRKELHGDGRFLSDKDARICGVDQLDTIMPGSVFSTIERLVREGFAVGDLGIADHVGYRELTLVIRIGDRWLKVISWKKELKDGRQSW
ncbi:MAG: hypothetical protein FJ004_08125 [Chloroflexi bacterium]|nr:hypothetical protein [Chloroflexota bacterium]